ncbi:MAG TPA: M28 family peptidase [Candidatus Marinimicrobia bacterium]|nr:M28 family peptidase [Candidatus Neomarinimicrobiota bacterium]
MESLLEIVHFLSSKACNGRRVGTEGWKNAQDFICRQLKLASIPPLGEEYLETLPQLAGGLEGKNILAVVPGNGLLAERYLLIEAHYDHLGEDEEEMGYFPGADDNAAAVAIILHTAKDYLQTKDSHNCRSLIIASFDSEEPPFFNSPDMGAERFCEMHPELLPKIDLAIVLDLMGHGAAIHGECSRLQDSFFVAGAEKCGIGPVMDSISRSIPELYPQRIGNHAIPPLGNYIAFQKRKKPFLFMTSGRNKYYHSLFDSAERLDYPKIQRTVQYLSLLVRKLSTLEPHSYIYNEKAYDDLSTLLSLKELFDCLGHGFNDSARINDFLEHSVALCRKNGNLNEFERSKLHHLLAILEKALQ